MTFLYWPLYTLVGYVLVRTFNWRVCSRNQDHQRVPTWGAAISLICVWPFWIIVGAVVDLYFWLDRKPF